MRKFSVMGENPISTGEWASLRILFHSHHHFSAAVSIVVGIAESIVMVFLHLIITVSWRPSKHCKQQDGEKCQITAPAKNHLNCNCVGALISLLVWDYSQSVQPARR